MQRIHLTPPELERAITGWNLGGSMGLGRVRAQLKVYDYGQLLHLVLAELKRRNLPSGLEEQEAQPQPRKGEYLVPADAELDYCHSCDAEIVWTRTKNNKPMPLTVATIERRDGERYAVCHWADCPEAKEWKR